MSRNPLSLTTTTLSNDFFGGLLNYPSIDKLWDNLMRDMYPEVTKLTGGNFFEKSAYPKVDIKDYSDRREILAALPGLGKDDVTLEVMNGTLTLKCAKQESEESEKCNYLLHEIKRSAFTRTFCFDPKIFDMDDIAVSMNNSILKINVPRFTEEKIIKPKKLTIG